MRPATGKLFGTQARRETELRRLKTTAKRHVRHLPSIQKRQQPSGKGMIEVQLNVAALLVIGGYLMRFFFLIQAGTKKMTGSNNAVFFLGGGGFLGWGFLLSADGQS